MPASFDAQIRELREQGFSILENAFDAALCDEIVEEIRRLEAAGPPRLRPGEFTGHHTLRI